MKKHETSLWPGVGIGQCMYFFLCSVFSLWPKNLVVSRSRMGPRYYSIPLWDAYWLFILVRIPALAREVPPTRAQPHELGKFLRGELVHVFHELIKFLRGHGVHLFVVHTHNGSVFFYNAHHHRYQPPFSQLTHTFKLIFQHLKTPKKLISPTFLPHKLCHTNSQLWPPVTPIKHSHSY